MNQVAELTLDVREHPAVQTVLEKYARIESDLKKLSVAARERKQEALAAKKELGRLELEAAGGKKVASKDLSAARKKLEEAEANYQLAAGEIERRKSITVDVMAEILPAIDVAGQEATETLEPAIHYLTKKYVAGLAMMASAGGELQDIYNALSRSNTAVFRKYGCHQNIHTPHDSPVINYGALTRDECIEATRRHLNVLVALGYSTREEA